MENNKTNGSAILYIMLLLVLCPTVIVLKAIGLLPISWAAAVLSFLWLPLPLLALGLFVAFVLALAKLIIKEYKTQGEGKQWRRK